MQNRFKDWGDARIFLAVIREGSTLGAARVLGINQTTVARRLDVLEHTLGLSLFDKTTRGACPTEAAQRLRPLAEAIEDAADGFETAALAERSAGPKTIRITALDHTGIGGLGDVVSAFSEEDPNVTFEFIMSERFLDLANGEADVALRMTRAITDDRLVARRVGDAKWTYYASRGYAARNTLPDGFSDDMSPHRVIILSHIPSKRKNVLRCSSASEVLMALRAGQGIGPLPTFEGDRDPELVRCFEPPEGADLTAWLVIGPEAAKRPEVRRFTAFAAPLLARNLKGEPG